MDWQALWLSVKLSLLTTVVLLIVGPPTAYWLARSRKQLKYLVEGLVALPLVLPPTVLGFYLLLALGPRGPVGRLTKELFGSTLPFSFWGLVVASVVYSLPFCVQPLIASFEQIDPAYFEAARVMGSGTAETFLKVAVPMALPGLINAAVLSFAHTLGEFGVVLMIGGNIPGRTRTVSISIYDAVQGLDYAAANKMGALLLAVSLCVLTVAYAVTKRMWSVWPGL
jgi:molybdate transport system permease protein